MGSIVAWVRVCKIHSKVELENMKGGTKVLMRK
jgi:hypothetical protein